MKKIIISAAVAAMALSTSAMAIDNVKASGLAKLIYQGTDNALTAGDGQFDQTNAAGQASVIMGLTADLSTNLSGGVEVTGLSTLGLENNLVETTMAAQQDAGQMANSGGAITDDQFWISQAYIAYTMGKTTAKIGIQELDTPLAFTEKWNVVKNTFQAIVLVNQDIENVTLVGAYVGKGNSIQGTGSLTALTGAGGTVVNYDGEFESFHGGAYAVGALTSIAGVNAQAWYYDIDTVLNVAGISADAYWLEADTKIDAGAAKVFLGAQYAGTDTNEAGGGNSLNAFAVKAAADVAGVNLYAAYSSVDDDVATATASLGFANTATGDKTKLYTGTASIYADGATVANEDTKAWKIGAKTKMADVAFGASYTDVDYGANAATANANDEGKAWDAFVGSKVGPIALKGIYTNYTRKSNAGVKEMDSDTFRIIASAKF